MARAKTPGNGNIRRKQVATMPAVNSPEPKKNSPSTDLEVEIRRRAYELYEQRGRQEGRALEDWVNAERQLVSAPSK